MVSKFKSIFMEIEKYVILSIFKCLLRNNYLDSLRSLLSDPLSLKYA